MCPNAMCMYPDTLYHAMKCVSLSITVYPSIVSGHQLRSGMTRGCIAPPCAPYCSPRILATSAQCAHIIDHGIFSAHLEDGHSLYRPHIMQTLLH